MAALITTVLLTSLLGSLHCAGMCGAFVAFAVGFDASNPDQAVAPKARLHAAYNLGRLVTYTLLGAISGALGAAIDMGGAIVGIQRFAAILAASTMIVMGASLLLTTYGCRLPKLSHKLPRPFERVLIAGHKLAMRLPPTARALTIGLLTTLLPCGWLYAFAALAAGTASPLLGAITMAAFWLGTLPVLIGVGAGVQALAGRLGRHVPALMSCMIILVGVVTVFDRMGIDLSSIEPEGRASPASLDHITEQAASLDSSEAPCCSENRENRDDR